MQLFRTPPIVNLFLPLSILVSILGCGSGSDDSDNRAKLDPKIQTSLDPEMTVAENDRIAGDLNRLLSLRFDSSQDADKRAEEAFRAFFQGFSGESVVSFLNERMHYIVSPRHPDGYPAEPSLIALNLGTGLWFEGLAAGQKTVTVEFGDDEIEISSTRTGVIQVFPDYEAFAGMTRTGVWAHEARHSDCPGGIDQAGLNRLSLGEVPNEICAYVHSTCPPGHPYEGMPACDELPWGAYTVSAIFSRSIFQYCVECSEAERQEALATTIDMQQRVKNFDEVIDGNAGRPIMSSAGLVE